MPISFSLPLESRLKTGSPTPLNTLVHTSQNKDTLLHNQHTTLHYQEANPHPTPPPSQSRLHSNLANCPNNVSFSFLVWSCPGCVLPIWTSSSVSS